MCVFDNLSKYINNNLDVYLISLYCILVGICIYKNVLKKLSNIY